MRLFLSLLLLFGAPILFADQVFTINTISQTVSRIDLDTQQSIVTFETLGQFPNAAPNKAAIYDGRLLVALTYENRVQSIDLLTESTDGWFPLEDSAGPNDIVALDGTVYVSGNTSNKVYKFEPVGALDVTGLSVGVAPEGLAIVNGRLFVANTGFHYTDYTYEAGSVSVISPESYSVERTIPTGLNPRTIVQAGSQIAVICTGDYATTAGEVDFFDATSLEPTGIATLGGCPGTAAYGDDGKLYVGNLYPAGVSIVDPVAHSVLADIDHSGIQGGNALLAGGGWLASADAGDYVAASVVRFYSLNDYELMFQTNAGVGVSDLDFYQTSSVGAPTAAASHGVGIAPNPSRSGFRFAFSQPLTRPAKIGVYDVRGRLVRNLIMTGSTTWDGCDGSGTRCAPGVYLARVDYGKGRSETVRMSVIR
jgi:hypothetical protein